MRREKYVSKNKEIVKQFL